MTSLGGWQTIFGQAVRSRRQELELTLEEASAAAGVSRSHLNLIELGKATGISRDCAARIDAGLGSEGALLALLPVSAGVVNRPQVATRGEEMRRAEFNKAVLTLAAALLLDPERRVGAEAVDAALLDDHEALTAHFARRQHHARPQVILGPIREHLQDLIDLAGASAPPSLRPRLARVTAETAAIAGWVAFRGNGDLVTAHGQLAFGRECS
jgi:transcriptional regulator with XRE-family HTH domain